MIMSVYQVTMNNRGSLASQQESALVERLAVHYVSQEVLWLHAHYHKQQDET